MNADTPVLERKTPKRLFIVSLLVAGFSIGISNSVVTLLSVDIATTFFGSASAVALGAVSQLKTFNIAAEVVFALLLTVLAVRFRHKPLLLAGVVLVLISAVGNFLAPDLATLLVFFAMEGAGSVIVSVMSITLIGEFLPLKEKAKALSYYAGTTILVSIVGVLFVGYLAEVVG